MTENQVREIVEPIIQMLVKKNADYGDAALDFGHYGNMVSLWHKIKRYRMLVERQQQPNFESVDDTLRDIIGYSIIGLIISEQNSKVPHDSK